MSRAAELIIEIQRELNQIKKDYILYFSGSVKHEPLQKREYLMKRIRALATSTKMKPIEVFQSENIISKVQSNFRQWDKQLERKGLRIKRKLNSQSQQESGSENPESKPNPKKPLNKKSVRISNAHDQRDQVIELYDRYIQLMMKTGGENQVGFGKFQGFIQAQTQKFQNRGSSSVDFEIGEKAGKVVIRTKGS